MLQNRDRDSFARKQRLLCQTHPCPTNLEETRGRLKSRLFISASLRAVYKKIGHFLRIAVIYHQTFISTSWSTLSLFCRVSRFPTEARSKLCAFCRSPLTSVAVVWRRCRGRRRCWQRQMCFEQPSHFWV